MFTDVNTETDGHTHSYIELELEIKIRPHFFLFMPWNVTVHGQRIFTGTSLLPCIPCTFLSDYVAIYVYILDISVN